MNTRMLCYYTALIAAALAAYSNHFHNTFHFDDSHTIVENPHIRKVSNVPRFFTDPATFSKLPTHQVYRPVVTASLALDYRIAGGLNPWPFHASTFVWYGLLVAALFAIYRRLTGGNERMALFAAALFALHPVSAETVNYIIQRADLYATLGAVTALWIYIAKPQWRRYGFYLLPFVAAALSKPTALIFPLLLLVYSRIFERGTWLGALRGAIPAAAATAVTGFLLSRMVGSGFAPGGGDRAAYWITQTWVTLEYFLAFFWPAHLSADSDQALLRGFTAEAAAGVAFLVAMIAGAVWLAHKPKWRPVSFGIAWFLIALLPTALMPLAEVANDHRMFFPFAGLTLAVCAAAARLVEGRLNGPRRIALTTAACLVLAIAGYATHQRNAVWKSEESLWRDVTVKSPRNGRGWMNYGLTLIARGDAAGALNCFEKASPLTPNYALLEINTGIAKAALGRHGEAERHFQTALNLDANHAASHFFYGRWLLERKRYIDAANRFDNALRITPYDIPARRLLMRVHYDQQNWSALRALAVSTLDLDPADEVARGYQKDLAALDGQLAAARKAAALKPSPEAYLDLSLLYYRAGQFDQCVRAAQQALALRPGFAAALNNIAAAHNAMQHWDDGIAAAEHALRLDASNQLARNNLAWALAAKNKTQP